MRQENMTGENDWRLRGQDSYLQNCKFKLSAFKSMPGKSMHAHCEFCWHKFMEHPEGVKDCSNVGFCSLDGKYWICKEYYKDFQALFNLETIE